MASDDGGGGDDDSVVCLSPAPSPRANDPGGAAAISPISPIRARVAAGRTPLRLRKHSQLRKDWVAACGLLPRDGPAFAYVLESERLGAVYVGMSGHAAAETIEAEHDRGTRPSTRRRGPWKVRLLVGPFPTRVAAMRFERLLKHTGRAAGLGPKLRAAHRALDVAALDLPDPAPGLHALHFA
jgi:predicted GIY-YIG superfamily endonuclease